MQTRGRDMDALIAFMRTIEPSGEPTPLPPPSFEEAVTARSPDDYWRTREEGQPRSYHNAAEEAAYFAENTVPNLGEEYAQGRLVEGIEAARARYRTLLASRPDSIRFAVSLLDGLGHRLLREGRVDEAVAVFAMNAEAYPEVPITQGGLGEAYRDAGRRHEAKRHFERAVALSGEQAHPDWRMYWRIYRAHLERVTQQLENR